jgi:hypothetical protein
MTPAPVARFMASLFLPTTRETCCLLDAGAGVGALSCAFLDRLTPAKELNFRNVEIEAFEIDNTLRAHLETTLATYTGRLPVTYKVSSGDFIWEAACKRFQGSRPFSHAILNPPYKKINSASQHRLILRRAGINRAALGDIDFPSRRHDRAAQKSREFRLAVAFDPGDTDNLARNEMEREVTEQTAAARLVDDIFEL